MKAASSIVVAISVIVQGAGLEVPNALALAAADLGGPLMQWDGSLDCHGLALRAVAPASRYDSNGIRSLRTG